MAVCNCKNKVLSLRIKNDTFKVYGDLKQGSEIVIKYIGKLLENKEENIKEDTEKDNHIYIQYGYGNSWNNKETLEMAVCSFSDIHCYCCSFDLKEATTLNLAFRDKNNNWDLNENSSYSIEITPNENTLTKNVKDLSLEEEFKENKFNNILNSIKKNILYFFKNIGEFFSKDTKKIED